MRRTAGVRAEETQPVVEATPVTREELIAAVEAALHDEKEAQRMADASWTCFAPDVALRLRAVAEAKRKTAAAIERLASL